MKSQRFTAGELSINRTKQREGVPYIYVCLSGDTSRLFTDPKELLKFVKWPPKTPTGDALREWLASFEQKPLSDVPETDPTANTKMVT